MQHIDAKSTDASVIGLDLGTTALKGVLVDIGTGEVLRTAERALQYSAPAPGRVEHEAEAYWLIVADLLRELSANSGVEALAMCAASGNTLLADESGSPLTPIINWMDRRCVGDPPKCLRGLHPEEVREIAGWPCIDTFPLAHIGWLKENKPALFTEAERVCMNTDWLLKRLTGEWVMDHSTATTFHLQNQRKRRWHGPFLELLGIAPRQLSALAEPGAFVGRVTPAAAKATGLPPATAVAAGCFDHPAAALASGITEPGQLLLSCGTSWVGLAPRADRGSIIKARILCDPFLSGDGGPWAGIFSVTAIGTRINWYIENLIAPGEDAPLKIFDELASESPPGANGLRIDFTLPPEKISGSRADISRAVMEGASVALNNLLPPLKDKGFEFEKAVMVGGPSRSPIWPGILAETTGIELSVGTAHAGAQGAAMLATRALRESRTKSFEKPF